MEKTMTIPEFQTLQEMADFWDTHDLTMFEHELSEVDEPVFSQLKQRVVSVILDEAHYRRLKQIAEEKHLPPTALVNGWVLQLLDEQIDLGGTTRHSTSHR